MNDYYVIDGSQADAVDTGISVLGSIGQTLAGIAVTICIVSLILMILQLVATALIYKKAGEKWWKSLIPIYGQYVFYKIVWDPMWFWVSIGLGLVSGMASAMISDATVLSVVMAVVLAFSIVLAIMTNIKFAKSFGKSGAFAIGLIFFSMIFQFILAFCKCEYIGPAGIPHDEIHD